MNFYILAFFLLFAVSSSSPRPGGYPKQKTGTAAPAKIVFKSTDDGQTWQDISKGLFLRIGNGLYYNHDFAETFRVNHDHFITIKK